MTESDPQDEINLVRRCADGDEDAWVRFVDTQGPRIAGMARRMLLRKTGRAGDADVDEVVAEVFLALLRNERDLLRRYDPTWRLSTWLGVLCRTAVGRLMRRRVRPAGSGKEGAAAVAEEETRERKERVQAALDSLGGRDALLLRLRHLEGMDYRTIAELLGVDASSVGSLLSRARKKLKEERPELGEE